MRVVYVIDSLVRGGAEQSLAVMAPHLVSRGIDLEVAYFFEREGVAHQLSEAGVALHPVLDHHGRPSRISAFGRLLRQRRPDLVHTTLFEADVAGRLAARRVGIASVTSLVNVAYGPEQAKDANVGRVKLQLARLTDAASAKVARRFHALTSDVAQQMTKRLHLDPARVDVIPRGRDPQLLGEWSPARRADVRQRLGIEVDRPVLLAAARHEFQKGLDVLLDAMPAVLAGHPQALLLIAGREGAQTPRLRQIVDSRQLGESVRLLGARADVADLMCACDVFVLPSRWEGFGGVLLEAMALRCPIVACDLAAVREVLERTGTLVMPDDPAALAGALAAQLARTRSLGGGSNAEAAQRFASRFSIDSVAAEMVAFYERALGTGRR